MINVIDSVKLVNPQTFQPTMGVKLELGLELMQDQKNLSQNEDQLYSNLGRELVAKLRLTPAKRVEGMAVFNIDTPTAKVPYITATGDTREIAVEVRTFKVDSLDKMQSEIVALAGENADVFFYNIRSQITVDPANWNRNYGYLFRVAYVTEAYRKENNLIHCVHENPNWL